MVASEGGGGFVGEPFAAVEDELPAAAEGAEGSVEAEGGAGLGVLLDAFAEFCIVSEDIVVLAVEVDADQPLSLTVAGAWMRKTRPS